MLKLTGKDLQERLELRFPDYARRERERIEILRRLRAGEITDQISPYDKSRVETAVVQMESQGGLATLVPGGFILTATHCIKWDGRGKMALGVPHAEPVRTPSGMHFRIGVAACDPVSDLAVLGALDEEQSANADIFENWRGQVQPVAISKIHLELNESCAVWVLAHTGQWLTGVIMHYGLPGALPTGRWLLATKPPIESGTSGAPVVTSNAELIGVVSHTWTSDGEDFPSPVPVARLALPSWVLSRIDHQCENPG